MLLLAALLALLWLLHNNEVEEDRTVLIKDVLWLEQNLRFHLSGNEEQLQQLAADMGSQPDRQKIFRLRAGHLLKNNPDISQLLWFDVHQQVLDALPSTTLPDQEIAVFGPPVTEKAFDMARRLGKLVYSEPFFLEGNRAFIEMMVPIFVGHELKGMLVAVYPLDTLLGNLVPWWFTEKYKVVLVDDNDIQYATKTNIEGLGIQSYEIPIDPPGYGMKLRVTSYQNTDNTLQRLLTLAIVPSGRWRFLEPVDRPRPDEKRSRAEDALRARARVSHRHGKLTDGRHAGP
ncbi:MAG: cache domain-containing protein [Betaproteobacteria bacterium]|nr:cache domain-containing protein [Betaproteobacteria bacterium]